MIPAPWAWEEIGSTGEERAGEGSGGRGGKKSEREKSSTRKQERESPVARRWRSTRWRCGPALHLSHPKCQGWSLPQLPPGATTLGPRVARLYMRARLYRHLQASTVVHLVQYLFAHRLRTFEGSSWPWASPRRLRMCAEKRACLLACAAHCPRASKIWLQGLQWKDCGGVVHSEPI